MTVSFGRGETRVVGLEAVDLDIDARRSVALWGTSGSGKTTLLHVLGGLVTPTRGSVEWSADMQRSPDRPRASGAVAYVFQSAALLPHFTALENVAFAAHVAAARGDASPSAGRLLQLVGLAERLEALPGELSGGEAQRVGIARALAQHPKLLLCDEPTGQLDSDTGSRVLGLIDALRRELDFALVVATHDPDVAARYDRVVRLSDGRIVADEVAA